MPYTANFTVSQSPTNPALVIITDTSTGSDPSIDSRRVTITDCYGNYLVPTGVTTNYIAWPLVDNPLIVNVLTQDTAVNIKVEWLDATTPVPVVLYDLDQNYCLSEYNKQFLYYLIQLQAHAYNIIQDNSYWDNVGTFWANIIGAINAVEVGNDIFASQACLNRATFMQQNESNYF